MMNKPIDADALLAWYDERRAEARYRLMDGRKRSIRREARIELSLLDQMYFKICKLTEQTLDVEEVKHGKWIVCGTFDDFLKCSECGAKYPAESAIEFKSCPICRAKMDKEEEK